MPEETAEDTVARHTARNEKLVEKIKHLGGNLHDTRRIDFFFYAQNQKEGEGLASDLAELGFVNVQTGKRKDGWAITAVRLASVSEITQKRFVAQVASVAAKYGAEFDGWGTAV